MPPRKKEPTPAQDPNQTLDTQLKVLGYGNFADLANGLEGLTISTISTGYPSLDLLLCERMPGMPRGRDVEIFSDRGSAGKSTAAACIARGWQHATHLLRLGDDLRTVIRDPLPDRLKTAWVEVEGTTTVDYLHCLGVGMFPNSVPGGYHLRFYPADPSRTTEDVLTMIRDLSNVFDLIVVDSVAALCNKADIEKKADETNKIAGLPQLLGRFYPKNTVKKATILWLNQTRSTMQTNQAGRPITKTVGGQAQTFYPSIKLDLVEVEKIKETVGGVDQIWGVRTKFYTAKNKISPQYRSCLLPMILERGYSVIYDYLEQAKRKGLIIKSGSWLELVDLEGETLLKVQGERRMFEELEHNAALADKLIKMVDGVDGSDESEVEEAAA